MFPTNFRIALRSLLEHWQRAILSALGVFVASVAIILLISIAIGVREDLTTQVRDLGVNTLIVMPGKVVPGQFNPNLGGQSYLTERMEKSLVGMPGVERTAPITFAGGGVKRGKEEAFPIVIATTADWFRIRPAELREGGFWQDPENSRAEVVLGSIASDLLFGEGKSAVGQSVTINGKSFRVVGVTRDQSDEQSLFSMGSFQNVAYIPYHWQKSTTSNQQTDRIMVQSAPDAEPKALVSSITARLATQLDDQQFSVLTQEDLLKLVYKLMSILTWLLTGLTSIALFVGGVGIMAIMLMSVGERAKEIGVRKATGARSSDIGTQFLLEALLITMMGTTAGLGFSAVVSLMLARWTPVKPHITPGVILLSAGVGIGLGCIFGLWPARRAAHRDPVESLRNE